MLTANAAWLVLAVMAFNLTRAAATIAGDGLARATTATIRHKLVSVPARIALSARRCDVLYAMLRDGTIYQPQLPATP